MTNTTGDDGQSRDPYQQPPGQFTGHQPSPDQPSSDQPGEQPGYGQPGAEQPGFWEQQAQRPMEPPAPPGYGQQPYGAPQGYGGPPGYPYQAAPPTEGRALAAMIVGIVSLVLACGYGVGLLGAPVAWFLGKSSMNRIDASNGQLGGRGMAQAGFVMGIIGTVLLVVLVIAVIGVASVLVVNSNSTSP